MLSQSENMKDIHVNHKCLLTPQVYGEHCPLVFHPASQWCLDKGTEEWDKRGEKKGMNEAIDSQDRSRSLRSASSSILPVKVVDTP